jgi:hypothetical protein
MIRCVSDKDIKATPYVHVEFHDSPDDLYKIAFHFYQNDRHILEVSGAHAREMLIGFLDGATKRHLEHFMLGIGDRLWEERNDTN